MIWDRIDHETIQVQLPNRTLRVTDWHYYTAGRGWPSELDSFQAQDVETGETVERLTPEEEDALDTAIRAFVEEENR